MVDIIVNTFKSNISEIIGIVNEIKDSKLYLQSKQYLPETICHPIWTLGHMITSIVGMRGEEMYDKLDKTTEDHGKWNERYGQDSDPIPDPSYYHTIILKRNSWIY